MIDSLPKKRFFWLTLAIVTVSMVWIIIAGIVQHSFWVSISSFFLGITCWTGASKLYLMRPERAFAIFGTAVLWCVITNLVFANILTLPLPDELSDVHAPFLTSRLTTLNVQIGLLSLIGFVFIIMDLVGNRRN